MYYSILLNMNQNPIIFKRKVFIYHLFFLDTFSFHQQFFVTDAGCEWNHFQLCLSTVGWPQGRLSGSKGVPAGLPHAHRLRAAESHRNIHQNVHGCPDEGVHHVPWHPHGSHHGAQGRSWWLAVRAAYQATQQTGFRPSGISANQDSQNFRFSEVRNRVYFMSWQIGQFFFVFTFFTYFIYLLLKYIVNFFKACYCSWSENFVCGGWILIFTSCLFLFISEIHSLVINSLLSSCGS